MPYRVKTFRQILTEMLSTVRANSPLTDFNVGSVIRTILEAAALQDADQNVQIAKLRSTFSIDAAEGDDLDRRAADYGITRRVPTQAFTQSALQVGDSLVTAKVDALLNAGVSGATMTLVLTSAAAFPTTGFVIIDRDVSDAARERVEYNNKSGNTLYLVTGTTKSHLIHASVILSQQGEDHPIPTGTVVYVPATDSTAQLDFETTGFATLLDGEVSVSVAGKSRGVGAVQNVTSGRITSFSSAPWQTATVTNVTSFVGGLDRESDIQLRDRIRSSIQSSYRATERSIKDALYQIADPTTGDRIISVQVLEPVTSGNPVLIYIDNGAGTASQTEAVSTEVTTETGDVIYGMQTLIRTAKVGQRRCKLGYWPVQASSVKLYRSESVGAFTYVAGTRVCTLSVSYASSTLIGRFLVDSNGRYFRITANSGTSATYAVLAGTGIAPATGAYAILGVPAMGVVPNVAINPLVSTTDYVLNETTGDIELVTGFAVAGGVLVAGPSTNSASSSYSYYTGLIALAQKVVNGDPSDLTTYPGVKAAGIKVMISTPTIDTLNFTLNIVAALDQDESVLYAGVKAAIEGYVNNLGIGEDVVISRIIERALSVTGVEDVTMITPTSNIAVLDGHIARTTQALISVV